MFENLTKSQKEFILTILESHKINWEYEIVKLKNKLNDYTYALSSDKRRSYQSIIKQNTDKINKLNEILKILEG